MVKKFQRRQEDFICDHCGASVQGDGYTDHCPKCLYGKHVDIFPGDRLEECHGLLKPVAIFEKKGARSLEYQCMKCGELIKNKVSDSDAAEALLILAKDLAKKWSH